MSNKRTLELSHEQIEILLHSLNIAEMKFSKNYQNILEDINLPCNLNSQIHREEIIWIDKYRDSILKLLKNIKEGELDI